MLDILIIGRGVSGAAAAELATALGRGCRTVADADTAVSEIDWPRYDLVVVSPGVRQESALLQAALARDLEVIGELEFGARHYVGPMVAVTGTNGKTTTVELTAHILRAVYPDEVAEAGNIGTPLSAVAAKALAGGGSHGAAFPLAVVEVSSFQLERAPGFAPVAAAILNVASDHLDRYHGSLEEYAQVKYRIFDRVAPENRIAMHGLAGGAPMRWSIDAEGVLRYRGQALFAWSETQLAGPHNLENLLAALELSSRVAGDAAMTGAALREAVKRFRTGRHRLETVAEFDGVRCIDDSKATNPASVAAALDAVSAPVRLLLGGLDKGMDFSSLRRYASQVRRAYLIGRAKDAIRQALGDVMAMTECGTLEEAVDRMVAEARAGEVVLLSPACASMDMFKDYKERGDRFRDACRAAQARREAEAKESEGR